MGKRRHRLIQTRLVSLEVNGRRTKVMGTNFLDSATLGMGEREDQRMLCLNRRCFVGGREFEEVNSIFQATFLQGLENTTLSGSNFFDRREVVR